MHEVFLQEGKFHSAKPYQGRSDAIIIAYRSSYGSHLNFAGRVIRDSKVDVFLTSRMFDDDVDLLRAKCLDFKVSLAPDWVKAKVADRPRHWYSKLNSYGWRDPTTEEVAKRKQYCEQAYGTQEVLDQLRWR